MKKIILSLTVVMIMGNTCSAQYRNWNSNSPDNKNSIFTTIGYDYGLTLKAGYNHSIDLFKPVILGIDFSVPMGENLFDDHRIRIGGEIELLNVKDFYLSAMAKGIIRRFQSDYVNIVNLGGDCGLSAGYYKSRWYLAGEFGYEMAISSQLDHSYAYKEIYPLAKDGWYVPSGGQFYAGLSTGFSLMKIVDIILKAGLTNARGQDTNALLPYYAQIGLSKSF